MIYEVYIFRHNEVTGIWKYKNLSDALDKCDTFNGKEYQSMGIGAAWKANPGKDEPNATVRTREETYDGR